MKKHGFPKYIWREARRVREKYSSVKMFSHIEANVD